MIKLVQSKWIFITIFLWITAVGYGFDKLWTYSALAGSAATAQDSWPTTSQLPSNRDLPTLVMIIHPQCACSRASLQVLKSILPKISGQFHVQLLFYAPSSMPLAWAKSDIWESAEGLPGVHTFLDKDGVEAKLFGASTSGQVLLFGKSGDLLFSGGITASRGHEGESTGSLALIDWVRTGFSLVRSTPVFGCHIFKNSDTTASMP
ncbi:MAG: hypothetical protein EOP04_29790 [Proteobacteria bacterium]|nr:MAG: hypothetical protein EOP04_29790 [Pseudomonadota bacterium]